MSTNFTGWPTNTFSWLADLAQHNNKAWFTENRAAFDDINDASKDFVVELQDRLGDAGIHGETKVWRIHRDQRFAKGEPYKTTHDLGLFDEQGALHGVRIEPTGVTLAFGVLPMSKPQLVQYRAAITEPKQATALAAAITELRAAGFEIGEPELKRPLKELPDGHPHPDLSRHKGLFVTKFVGAAPKWMFSAEAVDRVIDELGTTASLRTWLLTNVA